MLLFYVKMEAFFAFLFSADWIEKILISLKILKIYVLDFFNIKYNGRKAN